MTGELIQTGDTFDVGRIAINDAFSGTAEFNNIALDSGGDLSGGTGGGRILSGGTDLYDIFSGGTAAPDLESVLATDNTSGAYDIDFDDDQGITWNSGSEAIIYDGAAAFITVNATNGIDIESGALLSGGTDLYSIFSTGGGGGSTTASNGLTKTGDNITLGGTLTADTTIDAAGTSFTISSGTSIFLKGTDTPVLSTALVGSHVEHFWDTGSAPGTSIGGSRDIAYLGDIAAGDSLSQIIGNLSVSIWNQSTTGITLQKDVSMAGIQARSIVASAGTVDHAAGGVFKVLVQDSLGTIDMGVGIKTEISNSNIGNVNEFRGVYIPDMTGTPGIPAVNKRYGIYQADNGYNYLEGALQVNDGISGTSIYSGSTDLSDVFAPIGGGGIGGSGTTNKIAKFAGATTLTDSVISDIAGRVSIDSTFTFEVNTSLKVTGDTILYGTETVRRKTTEDYGTVAGTLDWNLGSDSMNGKVILSGNVTLNILNVENGDYGTLKVVQDGTGGHSLTLGAGTHKVANGGSGSITLTSSANAIDVISFFYDGTEFLWNVGPNYT